MWSADWNAARLYPCQPGERNGAMWSARKAVLTSSSERRAGGSWRRRSTRTGRRSSQLTTPTLRSTTPPLSAGGGGEGGEGWTFLYGSHCCTFITVAGVSLDDRTELQLRQTGHCLAKR